jgi:glycosyltransferase involved in cell wall biosynthesis
VTNNPLLTIGIPAVNEGRFLESTLKSILDQTFKDFIVLICEDSSTDDTLEIAKRFEALDNRVKVWPSDRKLNFVENWGRSIQVCNTKYFSLG